MLGLDKIDELLTNLDVDELSEVGTEVDEELEAEFETAESE